MADEFRTPELNDLRLLQTARDRAGAQPTVAIEAAWCFEFHAELAMAAASAGEDLILMGGHATSLRIAAHGTAARGSRDIDYIVVLEEDAVDERVKAVAARIADAARRAGMETSGCFAPERIIPPADAPPLPLLAYRLRAPAVLGIGGRDDVAIKLEFHLFPPDALPECEDISGVPFALEAARSASIPTLPWQFALKVVTLREPPIGIPAAREAHLPRHIYDLDCLLAVAGVAPAPGLAEALLAHDAYECNLHGVGFNAGGLWRELDDRLESLAIRMTDDPAMAQYVSTFQASQLPRSAHRTPARWRARVRRIQIALRLAARNEFESCWVPLCRLDGQMPATRKDRGFAQCKQLHGRPLGPTTPPCDQFWERLATTAAEGRCSLVDQTAAAVGNGN